MQICICKFRDEDVSGTKIQATPIRKKRILSRPTIEFINFHPEAIEFVDRKVKSPSKVDKYTHIGRTNELRFKMVKSDSRLIKTLLHAYGFTQASVNNPVFNLLWTGAHLKSHILRNLKPWQRANHFPRSYELTRKDKLSDNIARAKRNFGTPFDFMPKSFVTPRDLSKLSMEIEENSQNLCTYIVKPINSCQGKGIHFVNKADEVSLEKKLLVSHYVANPLLVNGHKFDLRVYVAVTSFYPLICYVYSEGLARFASEQYSSTAENGKEFVHLTNYSLNKNSTTFVKNETFFEEDFGHKWTLGALLRHLQKRGVDSKLLMIRIEDLVTKTLLSVQSTISAKCRTVLAINTNFELFGFDILVDSKLKPWLLEVNLSPSLTCDAPLDSLVKTRLICDLFNLACIPFYDRKPRNGQNETPKIRMASPSLLPVKKSPIAKNLVNGRPLDCRAVKHIRKLRFEDARRGGFIRVFPRVGSFHLYKELMSHSGVEKWDERLYESVFGEKSFDEEGVFAQKFHEQLMKVEKFPSTNLLDNDVSQAISTWLDGAEEYLQKVTREGETYMAKLPLVRESARLRTKSCSDFYEARAAAKLVEPVVENFAATYQKEIDDSIMPLNDLTNSGHALLDFANLIENRSIDANLCSTSTATTVSC
ncbi:unnamed protein product, partial [Mesorhabditis belari]|uniref:Tubulin--tyrosine ligase-like protein 5 n=1 Tax=Mesorhabditis belari TaxID=2138241 RepID=A0AAF3EMI5_9BILA